MTRGRDGGPAAVMITGTVIAVVLLAIFFLIIPGIPLNRIFGTKTWSALLGDDTRLRRTAVCPGVSFIDTGQAESAGTPSAEALQAVVHPSNQVSLNEDELRAIMAGGLRDWSAVRSLNGGAVTCYTADAEILERLGLLGEGTIVLPDWDQVLDRVRRERSAIALVPIGLVDFHVRTLFSPFDSWTGEPLANPETESIVVVGDVMLANWMEALLVTKTLFAGDQEYPFGSASPILRTAGICAANLECPIVRKSGFSMIGLEFGGDPTVLDRMAAAGFDVVSLANNHALNKGPEGLAETLEHIEARSIAAIGAGRDFAEAYAPRVLDLGGGTKVAWLGFSTYGRVPHPEDEGPALAVGRPPLREHLDAVRRAREEADLVVVFMHWGIEFRNDPDPDQRELAHQLADAGADLIVGAHPHCVQGIEIYGDSLIVYSLGNFAFGLNEISDRIAASTGGAMLLCRVLEGRLHQFDIIPVLEDLGEPVPLSADCTDPALRKHYCDTMDGIYANSFY